MSAYQEILDIDSTVVVARAGLARSKSRAQLNSRLDKILDNPLRLSDDAVYSATRTLYQQALALDSKGPLLREKLARLNELLQTARTPVPVQQLELKPGTYTAVGVRQGYRDVRREFTVDRTEQGKVIEIACTEPI